MLSMLLIEGGETAVAGAAFFGYVVPRLRGTRKLRYRRPMMDSATFWKTVIQHRMDVNPDWQWRISSQGYVNKAKWAGLGTNDERNAYIERTFSNSWKDSPRDEKRMWSAMTNIHCRSWDNNGWLASGTLKYDDDSYNYIGNTIAIYFYERYQSPEEIEREAREAARQIMTRRDAETEAKDARRRAEAYKSIALPSGGTTSQILPKTSDNASAAPIFLTSQDSKHQRDFLAVKGIALGKLPPSPLRASIDDEDLLLKIFGEGDLSPWASNAMKRMETAFGINKRSVSSLFGF